MLKQISIFAENTKGMFKSITGILHQGDINILGSVTNDSAEYGIVRMVVSDPAKALTLLGENNFICRKTEVLGIELPDRPGSLNNLLGALLDSNINVDYLYLSFNRESGMPVMIFHTDDIYEVESCMKSKGFTVL